MRLAFNRVDIDESGVLALEQLPSAFEQVGMAPTQQEIADALRELGKPLDGSEDFTFADFAQAADMLSPVG